MKAWINGNRVEYKGRCPWCKKEVEKLKPTDRKCAPGERVCLECHATVLGASRAD